jgi:hypothetical protein
MSDECEERMVEHSVDFPDTVRRRTGALTALNIKHSVSEDGKRLMLERDVTMYSAKQKEVIQWVRNPFEGLGLLHALDLPAAKAVVMALAHAYLEREGRW